MIDVFLASFLINLRHFFYTLTLLNEIKLLKHKFYAIFALTDESFAVLKSMKKENDSLDERYFWVLFLNHSY